MDSYRSFISRDLSWKARRAGDEVLEGRKSCQLQSSIDSGEIEVFSTDRHHSGGR